ncbi:MAG: DUF1540 domain-containing protein [Defluviitaleaceae bacterium]|nr:DUF1540 domain-containing protein [Defluviitaleaceae bacterium]
MAQINCHVKACRHNDQGKACALSSITVGNTTPSPHCCEDTECDSFEE